MKRFKAFNELTNPDNKFYHVTFTGDRANAILKDGLKTSPPAGKIYDRSKNDVIYLSSDLPSVIEYSTLLAIENGFLWHTETQIHAAVTFLQISAAGVDNTKLQPDSNHPERKLWYEYTTNIEAKFITPIEVPFSVFREHL